MENNTLPCRLESDTPTLTVTSTVAARPVRELKGFRRVTLKAGESQVLEFAISTDDLSFYNNEEELLLEPGKFEVYAGGNSIAPLAGEFEVVE